MSAVTDRQREELLSLMAKHPELARGFCHPYDRSKVWTMWKKFSKRLNSLGAGCKKTPQKWRHYWADLKSKARRKRAVSEPLCDFDLRLLDLAGEAEGRKPKKVSRFGAPRLAVPCSPKREEVVLSDAEEHRLESPIQQEVSSSSQSGTASINTDLSRLMARIEEAEARAGASSGRLLAVMRRQLAVQEQQIACLQRLADKLLARSED